MTEKIRREALKELAKKLPNRPGEDAELYVKSVLEVGNAIVYRVTYITDPLTEMKRKVCKCTCTACGNTFYEEYADIIEGCHSGGYGRSIGFVNHLTRETVNSYSETVCPECNAKTEAVHISKLGKGDRYVIKHAWVGEIFNVDGNFAMLSYYYTKECDKEGRVEYVPHECEGVLYFDGRAVRVYGYGRNMCSTVWYREWRGGASFRENFGRWQKAEMFYSREVIESTNAANCAIADFIDHNGVDMRLGAYFYIWTKFPNIENLVKSGYSEYVDKVIDEMTTAYCNGYSQHEKFEISKLKEYVNTKKAKPHEILRVDKSDRFLWKSMEINRFAFMGYIRELYGIRLDAQRIEQCFNEGLDGWYSVLQRHSGFLPPLIRTFNYLDREKHKHLSAAFKKKKNKKYYLDEQARANLIRPTYLYDYWNMLYKVYGEFPEELKYPKDLIVAHDDIRKLVKEKEDNELRQKFIDRAACLSVMAWEDKTTGLLIRPAASQLEIIAEGEFLHHCVARYAERHAKGTTSIFFIRKIKAPDTPFFTLEWKNNTINQNLGMQNLKTPENTPIVKKFQNRWLEHLKTLNTKEINDGKRNSTAEERERAGA